MTKLLELYQEELGSSFTSYGHEYDLNALLIATEYLPIDLIAVKFLNWVFEFDTPHPERVATADLRYPILVVDYDGTLVAVDGLHRLAKADMEGIHYIKCKMVPIDMLEQTRIK
jgi:hypothetical protein